ncbi:MAG: glutaredoxin 3 [Desulfobacteraceae bacterium]|nr:glutaredoxin 3 [Desulfobacteraceae bacterium]MBC2757087.1 glutaredoxin 3 [Desulfobacteraceae bacterium]MBC2763696.1 glutaredoxin 3 [ANME-2 cluster archaeon]
MINIDVYTSASCPYCIRAKALLKSKGLQFNELVVDGNPELIAESVKRSDGMRTIPQIFIENFHVGGYDDLSSLDQNGKLDSLLGLNN